VVAAADKVIQEPPTPSGIVLESISNGYGFHGDCSSRPNFSHRALPPLPPATHNNNNDMHALEIDEEEMQLMRIKEDEDGQAEGVEENVAFASSIQKVKDVSWNYYFSRD